MIPPTHPLASLSTRLFFGPAGWSYSDWKGIVYPPGVKDGLAYLKDYFDTIEINATFYRPPTKAMARSWIRRVEGNPRFTFTLKAFQAWTHKSRPKEEIENYLETLDLLAEAGRLGGILFQFPWRFNFSNFNMDLMERIVKPFESFPRIVEVRHASFDTPPFRAWLKERGIALANIDQPPTAKGLKGADHVTAALAYVRLHGRNVEQWFHPSQPYERYNYRYRREELKPWAERILSMARQSSRLFIIANNHYRGKALLTLYDLMDILALSHPPLPPLLASHYG